MSIIKLFGHKKPVSCGDNNCVIAKAMGAGTNGGCDCVPYGKIRYYEKMKIVNALRY